MENPLEVEVWKDIPNFEGYYQVSSFGRTRSMTRYVNAVNCQRKVEGQILNPLRNEDGYLRLHMSKEGKRYYRSVHVLVAITFMGHKPKKGMVVDHIDGDPTNDKLSNLQIVTIRENTVKGKLCEGERLTGARWSTHRNHWFAILSIDGKRKRLGTFKTELEAHQAYLKAVSELK